MCTTMHYTEACHCPHTVHGWGCTAAGRENPARMEHRNTQRAAGQGGDQIAGFLTQEKRARQFSGKPLLRVVTFAPELGGLQHEAAPGRAHSARGYGSGAAVGVGGGARVYRRRRHGVPVVRGFGVRDGGTGWLRDSRCVAQGRATCGGTAVLTFWS